MIFEVAVFRKASATFLYVYVKVYVKMNMKVAQSSHKR